MSEDRIQNGVDCSHHLSVRKTNDREAKLLQVMGSPLIMSHVGLITMLVAIDLNNQF